MTGKRLGRIGGHRGLDVIREFGADGEAIIRKKALHDIGDQGPLVGVDLWGLNQTAIHNEAFMLDVMTGSGVAPSLIDIDCDSITQEDMGVTEAPHDAEAWRQNLVRMLATIRSRGLRHGDLKGDNIITCNDVPCAVDWQEAHYLGDVAPQRSPFTDSYLLMQHIEGTPDTNGRLDVPRVARRWRAVLGSLGAITNLGLPLRGKTFLDIGCFQGDFVALAATEGMEAYGVDLGGFRPGEDSIEIGRSMWRGFPFGSVDLYKGSVNDVLYHADVVMMFSTWPYILNTYGYEFSVKLLNRIVEQAGVLFFETQYAGDGPGPEFLKNDEDVRELFGTMTSVKTIQRLANFPVTFNPSQSRTVWRIEQ